jgi:hypothetical protein
MRFIKKDGKLVENNKIVFRFFICFLILFLFYCQNPKINNATSQFTYIPLHAGDIRQMINIADSSTILITIAGSKVRTDGQEVFIEIQKYGIGSTQSSFDTSYCFLRAGFLIYTEIDTVKDSTGVYKVSNLFQEQQSALEKPSEGFKWYPVQDEHTRFCSVRFAGNYQTLTSQFNDVFVYDNWWYVDTTMEVVLCTYYARNVGLIGSEWINEKVDPQKTIIRLTYAKIGSDTYGNLVTERDPTIGSMAKKFTRNHTTFSFTLMGRVLLHRR